MRHIPVLLHEAVESLTPALKKDNTRLASTSEREARRVFVDGTLGSAGHSALVAERFGDDVEIIGLDRDADALARSEEKLRTLTHSAFLQQGSFRNLDEILRNLGISKVDAILLDLGISSNQLEESGRGFSFQKDEPLSMSMSKDGTGLSAKEIVNTWDESALELIIRGFGEEKFSRRIAREIVARREVKAFERTFELVDAIRAATPVSYHRGKLHPATRTFQALRIATNEELVSLEEGLAKGFEALNSGGRFAVISFHSLEDRIVKNFFRDRATEEKAKLITKRPIVPTEVEVKENPRSRSAKMRILEKL